MPKELSEVRECSTVAAKGLLIWTLLPGPPVFPEAGNQRATVGAGRQADGDALGKFSSVQISLPLARSCRIEYALFVSGHTGDTCGTVSAVGLPITTSENSLSVVARQPW